MRMSTNALVSSRSHVLRAATSPSLSLPAGLNPFVSVSIQVKRSYAAPSSKRKEIAVLGGGITGLSTAKYLTDAFPDANITLLENSNRLAGWMQTHRVTADDGTEIVFHSGPRSLRPSVPNGTLAMRLIEDIGLADSVVVTPKNHPSARNRFIYYPDRLVRLPGPGLSIFEMAQTAWSSGLFSGVWSHIVKTARNDSDSGKTFSEALHDESRSNRPDDQSVGEFISSFAGENFTNNVVSAGLHGIYAGDVWQLSARSIVSTPWELSKRMPSLYQMIKQSMYEKKTWSFRDDMELQATLGQKPWSETMLIKFANASVFSFKKGIQELPDKLVDYLQQQPNVKLISNASVVGLERRRSSDQDQMAVKTGSSTEQAEEHLFDHVISTIPSKSTHALLPAETVSKTPDLGSLNQTHAVSVGVVNLWYPVPDLLKKLVLPRKPIFSDALSGFGYLLPNSISLMENPERALGVIFDSDIFAPAPGSDAPREPGTRLTVMLGGHWWDGWDELPSEADCVAMAQSVLARHLGLDMLPGASKATLQRACIPQYTVGHSARMGAAHGALQTAFGGRLLVAGSWYGGVGVNDCLRSAFETVHALRSQPRPTGLEQFAHGRAMALVRRAQPGVIEVLQQEEERARRPYVLWK